MLPYVIAILVTSLFLFGFLLLTLLEGRRGTRFFSRSRYRLDTKVSRTMFIVEHVDWGAFGAHLAKTTLEIVAHDLAHASLMAVRSIERFLTRAVRALRMRREGMMPLREQGVSRLTGTVTYLKQNLRRSGKPRTMGDIVRREERE